MSKETNPDIKILSEAINESLRHVSKDMLELKATIDALKKEVSSLKTKQTLKEQSVSRDLLLLRNNLENIKTKVTKIDRHSRIPTINESPMKRKDDIDDLITEMDKINLKIEKIENKLKM